MSVLTSVSRILQCNSSKFHRFRKPQNLYFENYGVNFSKSCCRENSGESDTYHTVFLMESGPDKNEIDDNNFGKTVRDLFFQKYLKSRFYEQVTDLTQGPEIIASQISCFDYITEPFSENFPLIRRNKSFEINESNDNITATSLLASLLPLSNLTTSVESKAHHEGFRDWVENNILHDKEYKMNFLGKTKGNEDELLEITCRKPREDIAPGSNTGIVYIKEHKMNLPGTLPEGVEDEHLEITSKKPRDIRPHLAPMPKTQPPPKMPPLPSCPSRVRRKNKKAPDCPRPPLANE